MIYETILFGRENKKIAIQNVPLYSIDNRHE